ncbi:MAG: hypothetical protein V4508_13010 [Pseudomonadota bacterium]
MGIDRSNRPKRDTGRDGGGFIALPWSVLDCPAYALLSHPARGLLFEFARQFVSDNNGRLLASSAYLAKRGWKSADVITRAKRELLDGGFIFETVMGHRPNKASWYAITWRALDKLSGYDPGASAAFERSAYRKNPARKITPLIPPGGVERRPIAPSGGVESSPPTPSGGAISPVLDVLSTPSHGNHLEMPSAFVEPASEQAENDVDKSAIEPTGASEHPEASAPSINPVSVFSEINAEPVRSAHAREARTIDAVAVPLEQTQVTGYDDREPETIGRDGRPINSISEDDDYVRERDDDRPAEKWNGDAGEWIDAPTSAKPSNKAKAVASVLGALADIGKQKRAPQRQQMRRMLRC